MARTAQAPISAKCEPTASIVHSIDGLVNASNGFLSRSRIYEEIAAGRLKARKFGKRTGILDNDFRDWLKALPEMKPVKAQPKKTRRKVEQKVQAMKQTTNAALSRQRKTLPEIRCTAGFFDASREGDALQRYVDHVQLSPTMAPLLAEPAGVGEWSER